MAAAKVGRSQRRRRSQRQGQGRRLWREQWAAAGGRRGGRSALAQRGLQLVQEDAGVLLPLSGTSRDGAGQHEIQRGRQLQSVGLRSRSIVPVERAIHQGRGVAPFHGGALREDLPSPLTEGERVHVRPRADRLVHVELLGRRVSRAEEMGVTRVSSESSVGLASARWAARPVPKSSTFSELGPSS